MRAESGALAHMLFGKGRGALLALLYGHPDQSFYYRQITRHLGNISAGTLQRELETLSHLGLVDRTTVGKQVFYRARIDDESRCQADPEDEDALEEA
jgi:DNA-binding HxlR family transcriptional regulator